MEKKKTTVQTKIEKFFKIKEKIKKIPLILSREKTGFFWNDNNYCLFLEDLVDSDIEITINKKILKIPSIYYNVLFYKNIIYSVPDGKKIKTMHSEWYIL